MAEVETELAENQKDFQRTPPLPGYRFYPTEEELVSFYLHSKLEDQKERKLSRVIPVVNVYEFEPWQLPKLSGELCNGDTEQWFFFVPRQEREARGGRPNRTTASGYWKATGSPSYVYSSNNRVIGVKKSMVFYKGKAPTGKKTTWKMNEYRAIEEEIANSSNQAIPKLRHEISLCRIYVISGSFRAFDRRPLGIGTRVEKKAQDDQETAHRNSSPFSPQSANMMDKGSSPEISFPVNSTFCGVEGGSNWKMAVTQGLWEQEQLNYIGRLP